MAYLYVFLTRIYRVIPHRKREISVVHPDMPRGAHFARGVRPATEIYEVGIVRRGIFRVFRFILFAVKLAVHISFRREFCRLLRQNAREPENEKQRAKDAGNDADCFLFHIFHHSSSNLCPQREQCG